MINLNARYFAAGSFYHIMTKSIAGYVIFREQKDFDRMRQLFVYYSYSDLPAKFSYYLKLKKTKKTKLKIDLSDNKKIVDIVAYCIMPTHIHLLLVPLKENSVSVYMKNLLNSYTRYFNTKYNRKGPLWQGRFKSVFVESNKYLLHLTRYIHLNPTTAGLVESPEDWEYSSYKEYIEKTALKISNYKPYLDIDSYSYKEFVLSRRDYQRELSQIKHLLFKNT